jgi:hypothetical protein
MSHRPLPDFDGCGSSGADQQIRPAFLLVYLLLGVGFGVVLTRSEVLSWFRIQEMFHFLSFRMYGIIGSAIATAATSIALIKASGLKSVDGKPIAIPRRPLGSGIQYAARFSLSSVTESRSWSWPYSAPSVEHGFIVGCGQSCRIRLLSAAWGFSLLFSRQMNELRCNS